MIKDTYSSQTCHPPPREKGARLELCQHFRGDMGSGTFVQLESPGRAQCCAQIRGHRRVLWTSISQMLLKGYRSPKWDLAQSVTSSQFWAIHFCSHIFCYGAGNRFSWMWIFWINFQSTWFSALAHHVAGQILLAGRRRTETNTAFLLHWCNSGSNPTLPGFSCACSSSTARHTEF